MREQGFDVASFLIGCAFGTAIFYVMRFGLM